MRAFTERANNLGPVPQHTGNNHERENGFILDADNETEISNQTATRTDTSYRQTG